MTPPVTHRFATFVAATDYTALSRNAIENAKLHILDTLGVALAGYEHPVANIVLDYCKFVGGTSDVCTSAPIGVEVAKAKVFRPPRSAPTRVPQRAPRCGRQGSHVERPKVAKGRSRGAVPRR